MNPIEELRAVVEEGQDRVSMIHRNEWPKLWAVIDKLVDDDFVVQRSRTVEEDEGWGWEMTPEKRASHPHTEHRHFGFFDRTQYGRPEATEEEE